MWILGRGRRTNRQTTFRDFGARHKSEDTSRPRSGRSNRVHQVVPEPFEEGQGLWNAPTRDHQVEIAASNRGVIVHNDAPGVRVCRQELASDRASDASTSDLEHLEEVVPVADPLKNNILDELTNEVLDNRATVRLQPAKYHEDLPVAQRQYPLQQFAAAVHQDACRRPGWQVTLLRASVRSEGTTFQTTLGECVDHGRGGYKNTLRSGKASLAMKGHVEVWDRRHNT